MSITSIFIIFFMNTLSFQLQNDKKSLKRFDVHDLDSYRIKEKIMIIVGDGIMTDCNQNRNWNENIQLISNITFQETVKSIGNGCFSEMKQIEIIELNEGIEEIGIASFQSTGMKEISIPSSVKIIKSLAFANSPHLEIIKWVRDFPARI